MTDKIKIWYPIPDDSEEDAELEVELNAKYEVCSNCRGKGTTVNPDIDGHGLTMAEMDYLGDDFREDYFSGVYDVACRECKGLRVVLVVDEENNPPEYLAEYFDQQQRDADYEAICRMERAMGC